MICVLQGVLFWLNEGSWSMDIHKTQNLIFYATLRSQKRWTSWAVFSGWNMSWTPQPHPPTGHQNNQTCRKCYTCKICGTANNQPAKKTCLETIYEIQVNGRYSRKLPSIDPWIQAPPFFRGELLNFPGGGAGNPFVSRLFFFVGFKIRKWHLFQLSATFSNKMLLNTSPAVEHLPFWAAKGGGETFATGHG